jgi:hypothetical protein
MAAANQDPHGQRMNRRHVHLNPPLAHQVPWLAQLLLIAESTLTDLLNYLNLIFAWWLTLGRILVLLRLFGLRESHGLGQGLGRVVSCPN